MKLSPTDLFCVIPKSFVLRYLGAHDAYSSGRRGRTLWGFPYAVRWAPMKIFKIALIMRNVCINILVLHGTLNFALGCAYGVQWCPTGPYVNRFLLPT